MSRIVHLFFSLSRLHASNAMPHLTPDARARRQHATTTPFANSIDAIDAQWQQWFFTQNSTNISFNPISITNQRHSHNHLNKE
jgi:hypothetical protein